MFGLTLVVVLVGLAVTDGDTFLSFTTDDFPYLELEAGLDVDEWGLGWERVDSADTGRSRLCSEVATAATFKCIS